MGVKTAEQRAAPLDGQKVAVMELLWVVHWDGVTAERSAESSVDLSACCWAARLVDWKAAWMAVHWVQQLAALSDGSWAAPTADLRAAQLVSCWAEPMDERSAELLVAWTGVQTAHWKAARSDDLLADWKVASMAGRTV